MTDSDIELNTIEEELEKIDPVTLITPNQVLDNIQIYDSTVEIIVDGIESPRIVGNKQQYKVFKFYLNNGNGRRIQVVAWNDDIERIICHILPNYIIHLDGVQARIPKIAAFNNGNATYELLIRNNTIISNLGKYEPIINSDEKPIRIELNEILNTTQRVILEAFVKTNFMETHDIKQNKMIGHGAITDGKYKLQIHIINFSNDEFWKMGINKGDKIELKGIMQTTNEPVYLLVNDIKDIRKLKGRMQLTSLLKGEEILKKRKAEENSQIPNKKYSI